MHTFSKAKYSNDLLKVLKYFPKVQWLQIQMDGKNSMNEDDFRAVFKICVNLKCFSVIGHGKELEFGSDFHRSLCKTVSDRPGAEIILEYRSVDKRKSNLEIKIKKDVFERNGKPLY